MSDQPTGGGLRAMPVLGVADVAASAAFYRDKLGFEIGGLWGPEDGPPGFGIVGLGRITIALDSAGGASPRPKGWSAYLYIAAVDAYCAALRERGVEIVRPPEDAFYGCRDFDIRDLDGHLLAFGQDLNPSPDGPGL